MRYPDSKISLLLFHKLLNYYFVHFVCIFEKKIGAYGLFWFQITIVGQWIVGTCLSSCFLTKKCIFKQVTGDKKVSSKHQYCGSNPSQRQDTL